jgi:hypothetical protein
VSEKPHTPPASGEEKTMATLNSILPGDLALARDRELYPATPAGTCDPQEYLDPLECHLWLTLEGDTQPQHAGRLRNTDGLIRCGQLWLRKGVWGGRRVLAAEVRAPGGAVVYQQEAV